MGEGLEIDKPSANGRHCCHCLGSLCIHGLHSWIACACLGAVAERACRLHLSCSRSHKEDALALGQKRGKLERCLQLSARFRQLHTDRSVSDFEDTADCHEVQKTCSFEVL